MAFSVWVSVLSINHYTRSCICCKRADQWGVEPRRAGMVCREVMVIGQGTSRRNPPARPVGYPACRPLRICHFSLDSGMQPVSNLFSGEPGEVPDNEINAH